MKGNLEFNPEKCLEIKYHFKADKFPLTRLMSDLQNGELKYDLRSHDTEAVESFNTFKV